jgi:hypothetical protein
LDEWSISIAALMLTVRAADARGVIHRAIVVVSLVCSGLVLASFVMFVRNQVAGASQHQAAEVVSYQPAQSAPPAQKQEGQPGRFINGAASKLTSPFRSIVQSTSAWIEHAVPTVLALLVYGVGLGFLARFSNGFA